MEPVAQESPCMTQIGEIVARLRTHLESAQFRWQSVSGFKGFHGLRGYRQRLVPDASGRERSDWLPPLSGSRRGRHVGA